jgi:signal transduction histidine kinase
LPVRELNDVTHDRLTDRGSPLPFRAARAVGVRASESASPLVRAAEPPLVAWRLDASLIASVILLCAATLAAWLGPGFTGSPDTRALDITINVSAILIGAAVAILAWVRWRDTGESSGLYVCSAFVASTVINGLLIALVLAGRDEEFGLAPARPGEAPIYLWTLSRLTVAWLLVLGAVRSLRREQPPLPRLLLVAGPTGLLLLAGSMLFARQAVLPHVPGVDALDPRNLSSVAILVGAVQVIIFVGFIVAAILFRRLYLRDRRISDAYLAVGLVSAAFSQLHFLIAPIAVIGVVTSTDALRLVFYGVLLLGIQAELGADLRALRNANSELERLREVDAVNATIEERSRLAREIHDGLAQDLWYAKLRLGRLVEAPELAEESRAVGHEVLTAVDSALADARQAVMALRVDPTAGSTLTEVLRSYTEDFSDRFALRTEFTASDDLPRLQPRTEAEVLRIVQEAMNNCRKHADATLVRVRAETQGGFVRVSVTDNGKGFDPGLVDQDRYGLKTMLERAALIGGRLSIESRPADGTTVLLEVPAAAGAAS